MVQAVVDISEEANQILNIVKARYNLKNKSASIELISLKYGEELLEPELRPEFIERMKKIEKERTIKIKDFRKEFGLK